MSTVSQRCAAAQAHRALVGLASAMLRAAKRDRAAGFHAAAQNRLERASDLLALTSFLHNVVSQADHALYLAPEVYRERTADAARVYVDLLRAAADIKCWAAVPDSTDMRAKVLLERMLVVRWGDVGAMLVSGLPRLSTVDTRRAVIPLENRQLDAAKRGEVLP